MGSSWQQFWLLMKKNWLLQKRKKVVTVLEIGLPVLFALILLIIRQQVKQTEYTEATTWSSFAVDEFRDDFIPIGKENLTEFLQFWRIAYTPDTMAVRNILTRMTTRLGNRVRAPMNLGFPSEAAMLEYLAVQNLTTLDVMGGLVFHMDDPTTLSDHFNYSIRLRAEQFYGRGARVRFTSSSDWYTSFTFPTLPPGFGPRQRNQTDGGLPGYVREGFLFIMRAIDMSVLAIKNSTAQQVVDDVEVRLKRHPFPPFVEDPIILILQSDFTSVLLISFLVVAPNICKDIVLEKERKLREMMKMMGLKLWLNWVSWFVKYVMFLLISVSLMTLFYHINLGEGAIITYTAASITWVFLFLYAVSVIMFCFMISVFFSKASSAAAAGGILFLLAYMPYYFYQLRYYSLSLAEKVAPSFLMNVAMCFGCTQLSIYESKGIGLQWSNFYKPVSVDDNFSMAIVMVMLLTDSLLYGLVAWYFDHLFPGEYGIPHKFYFPFTKQFWCGAAPSPLTEDDEKVDYGERQQYFEANPRGMKAGISIRNLTKMFKRNGEQKAAVNRLSLDMFENNVTALLGHNGAGKTTTMFMLTGFLEPTSGTAYVNDCDIRSDMKGVRESLGLCPQHDVLFDTLTVTEHLEFFAKLKGLAYSSVADEVQHMIEVLHLEDKAAVQAKALSGGMKRKLCVGIALIGGSKVVILDEPTSGMDPEARRQTWDIIQSQREGRTMLLSTHFMDEADYLGDRIAIMAEGVVQCAGSSLFLKGKYGVGYHMVIVKEPRCAVDRLTALIKTYVPQAALESNMGAEVSYVLPSESSSRFEEMFTDIERNKEKYGISSYGASVTTMEEVFLKVGESVDASLSDRLNQDHDDHTTVEVADTNSLIAPSKTTNGSVAAVSGGEGPAAAYEVYENQAYSASTDSVHNNSANGSTGHVNGTAVSDALPAKPPTYEEATNNVTAEVFGARFAKNSGLRLYLQQFRGLLEKRMLHTWRNTLITAVQLAVPLFFVIIACAIFKTVPGPREPPPLTLTMTNYRDPVTPYAHDNGTLNTELADAYSRYMGRFSKMDYLNELFPGDPDPDVEDYLVEQSISRYEEYVLSWMTAATIKENDTTGVDVVLGHFNNEAYHSSAVTVNSIDNTLALFTMGDGHNFTVTNHPLPRSQSNKIEEEWNTSLVISFILSYNVAFGMAFLAGSFIVFLIKERTVKAKHCQFVSGVHVFTFWASTFIWDIVNFMVPCLGLFFIYLAFGIDAYADKAGYTILTFLVFGWAILPCVYLFSFLFEVPSSGYVWITVLNILIGTIAIIVVGILKYPSLGLVEVGEAIEWACFAILPNYAFEVTMQYLFYNYETIRVCNQLDEAAKDNGLEDLCNFLVTINQTNPCCPGNCGDYCADYQDDYLAWAYPGLGKGLTFMLVQGIVFWIWIFIAESNIAKQWKQNAMTGGSAAAEQQVVDHGQLRMRSMSHIEEDSDVLTERLRVENLNPFSAPESLIISELKKFYGDFLAVDRISVGVPAGECFGLLGVNGAGKTTTFKMLTGDVAVSGGDAFLEGYSINAEIKKVRQKLGYCPQFDALIDQMTVRETLRMYGRLRGVQEAALPGVIDTLVANLLLEPHVDKQAGTLSGGNKRKLSTAIALIGDPPIVFLDEPTTGMDPVARRLLWDALTKVRDSGRTLVLTSHSMEECEALCTRLAIMVNGQFKCLGSVQHLKNKFGKGYTLMARVAAGSDEEIERRTQRLMDFVKETFPGSVLKDYHQGLVHYQIYADDLNWASVFGTMERAKVEYEIEDYSVSQTTLEQVFINFARAQREPQDMEKMKCRTKCANCFRFCCLCGCCRDQGHHGNNKVQHSESTDL